MSSKKKAQRSHFRRRCAERIGVYASKRLNDKIVKDIQSGRARFVKRSSLRVTIWHVDIGGQPVEVVYDKQRKVIVTVLTPAWPIKETEVNQA
jgi:hypothetical protein